MGDFLLLIPVLLFVFSVYCAWKADNVSLPYRTFNVYGKIKSYIFMNFIAVSFCGIIWVLYLLLSKKPIDYGEVGFSFFLIIIGMAVSNFIYKSAKNKCPDGPMKDKLAVSMIISGIGYTTNTVFFFLHLAGKIFEPKKAIDDKGRTIYIFPDDNVYDETGRFVGKKN